MFGLETAGANTEYKEDTKLVLLNMEPFYSRLLFSFYCTSRALIDILRAKLLRFTDYLDLPDHVF